jgi:hypothetical protein
MKLGPYPVHLTYSMNVHAGEHWQDQLKAIEQTATKVRHTICPGSPFGLGMRLSQAATTELLVHNGNQLSALRDRIAQLGMYVFTMNGFPYDNFHISPVKDRVYRPDWSGTARRDYTVGLADILSALLPGEDTPGSISTLPIAYRRHASDSTLLQACHRIAEVTAHLARLRERTGRLIHLGLEPEPDCCLESTDDCIQFFRDHLFMEGAAHLAELLRMNRSCAEALLRRHVGVCMDTCHLAVLFEDVRASLRRLQSEGILLSKLQISSAPKVHGAPDALRELAEDTYLHQTRFRDATSGAIKSWPDLPAVFTETECPSGEYRTHLHLPLYFSGDSVLSTTSDQLNAELFQSAIDVGCRHFEMETYTFNVLPPSLRRLSLTESIIKEYQWLLERIPQ